MERYPIILRGPRLAVELARPGSVYQGSRFDWTGMVTQVQLGMNQPGHGGAFLPRHTFCVAESFVPGQGTGGIGLCSEFGIENPVGYDEAKAGDCFPKFGVGLLVRPDDAPYSFARPYKIARLFPTHLAVTESQATFTIEPLECDGIAARMVRTVSVHENELTLACSLENVGRKPIVTREYCHNFVGIDKFPMGPDYRLCLSAPVTLSPPQAGEARVREDLVFGPGGSIRLRQTPQHPFYCRLNGCGQTDEAQWELLHEPSGVWMREYDDFAPVAIAVWGESHVISAEMFVGIHVKPGETQRWTRRYRFDDAGKSGVEKLR